MQGDGSRDQTTFLCTDIGLKEVIYLLLVSTSQLAALQKVTMLPNAQTVDDLLRWSCAMSLVLAIMMCVIDMTDCARHEKMEDHEGSKFYLRMTVAWPLC